MKNASWERSNEGTYAVHRYISKASFHSLAKRCLLLLCSDPPSIKKQMQNEDVRRILGIFLWPELLSECSLMGATGFNFLFWLQ